MRYIPLLLSFLPALVMAATLPSVPAPRQPVTNAYHGVTVVDDYQWLEEAAAPAVRDWTRLENERTRAYFAGLPYREGIAERLMGAFLTQRPDLARAVVSHVGIYDMLRVELDPNGQFNVTEFGTVKDPEQFKALLAYSPFHRVRDGASYPAVLFTTGENDGRVNPAQSRKMAARVQAATASDRPILFRSTASAGHGIGSSLKDRVGEQADVLSFLFDQLGIYSAKGELQ